MVHFSLHTQLRICYCIDEYPNFKHWQDAMPSRPSVEGFQLD